MRISCAAGFVIQGNFFVIIFGFPPLEEVKCSPQRTAGPKTSTKEKTMRYIKLNLKRWAGIGFASVAVAWAAALVPSASAASARRVAEAIWAHDAIYDVVATDTSFQHPPAHSTDVLFNFGMSGLKGQRSISESAPGDTDYNGGRWSVMPVEFTSLGKMFFDDNNDGMVDVELTNAEQVLHYAELGLLIIHPVVVYFECPLIPRR